MPRPEIQYPVRDGAHLVAVVDFAFPSDLVAIEADGYRWHSGRARFQNDRARRNRLTTLGWRVIHVTWQDLLEQPRAVVEVIRRTLARH
ncbi:MAG: endonuclease domain-containing protein [Actinomycetota bacterium]